MLDKKLHYAITNRNKRIKNEGSFSFGTLPWSTYRDTFNIWHRIPTENEYASYFFFCKRNKYDPESLDYIKAYMQK